MFPSRRSLQAPSHTPGLGEVLGVVRAAIPRLSLQLTVNVFGCGQRQVPIDPRVSEAFPAFSSSAPVYTALLSRLCCAVQLNAPNQRKVADKSRTTGTSATDYSRSRRLPQGARGIVLQIYWSRDFTREILSMLSLLVLRFAALVNLLNPLPNTSPFTFSLHPLYPRGGRFE